MVLIGSLFLDDVWWSCPVSCREPCVGVVPVETTSTMLNASVWKRLKRTYEANPFKSEPNTEPNI